MFNVDEMIDLDASVGYSITCWYLVEISVLIFDVIVQDFVLVFETWRMKLCKNIGLFYLSYLALSIWFIIDAPLMFMIFVVENEIM